ncbi:beta transducin-like protein HET-D2Y [Lasiosphaeria hispida]|uniref:Beta transducin-like protein HET-D2Y n=1 Tax=Lasiosphaeria hispida TaxID=260671 RepID=A0AAJ0HWJ2_9PEZI|nr:beta transducin-like protein HET-D2Y [Lasiosphaeria hispida]
MAGSRKGRKFLLDTCCIDKSDNAELQDALDSMFRWYRNAAKCYVYLTDVSTCQQDADGNPSWELAFRKSRWFTRGWTLQELIAPTVLEFFSEDRKRLGDKTSLAQHIHNTTGIPLGALQAKALSDFSFDVRMSWIKNRSTTREEDKAYCLFGILNVQMRHLYGEGEDRAFERLREEISKHDRHLANLHSTDPHLDKMRIEEAKGGLLADAYRWIFATPDFRRWHDEPQSCLLWIKGDPGKGKTMLLCGIINELEGAIVADGHCRNLAYFFCQATDSRINNAIAVLRGLIYHLAHQQPRLISHVRKYTDVGTSLSDANSWFALLDILGGMLGDPNLKPTCLVVDALDECVADLPKLLDFITRVSLSSSGIKWLLSSRNEHVIEREMMSIDEKARLSLELKENAEQIAHAVNLYIDYKLSTLTSLHGRTLLRAQIQDSLCQKANSTFLWVALVIQELEGIEHWDLLQAAEELPTGLYPLYDRMVRQIQQLSRRTLEFCQAILSTAVVTHRPLYLAEIGGLSGFPEEISGSTDDIRKIIAMCGSFLTVRDNQIYLVHQSVKDYLREQASILLFPCGAAMAHRHISNRSLKLLSDKLRRDIYGLCAPGFPIDQVRVPDPDPLATVRYSCIYWVDHLYDSQSSDNAKQPDVFQDGGIIDNFLRKHYLHWLEALSLCKSTSQGILSMTKLESILQQRTITSQLPSLVYDIRRFVLYYRWVVENHPLQVYASALVFSPARSITRGLFKQEVWRCVTTEPVVEDNWNVCQQTMEHSRSINLVVFSPDSKLVASGGDINSITFSPDLKLMASGSDDKTVKIWDVATGACTQMLEGHSGYINSITFSPDSNLIASGSNSKLVVSGSDVKTVKIWNVATGACTQTLEGHSGNVRSITFLPDLKLMVSRSYDKTVKIWNMATGACTQTLEGHSGGVNSITFSPDSKLVASRSNSNPKLIASGGFISSIIFSPDSKLMASGSCDKTIKIWNAATGACTQMLKGHSGYVNSIMFSPNSNLIASGSDDKTVKIWNAATGACTQTLEGHSSYVRSIMFSPDSKLMVSGSVNCIMFSPNSNLIASGSDDKTVKIWNAATGACMQTLKGHSSYINSGHSSYIISISFSPDSKLMASRSYDKTVKIWNAATGACMQMLKGHSSYTLEAHSGYTVKIWNAVTGACTQTLEGHSGGVNSIMFLPNSNLIASGSNDKTVKIWNTATGACTQTLEGHSGWRDVTSLNLFTSWSGDVKKPLQQYYSIDLEGRWITKCSENWLWLPPGSRSVCSAVAASTIAIGCRSGRVLVMTFLADS